MFLFFSWLTINSLAHYSMHTIRSRYIILVSQCNGHVSHNQRWQRLAVIFLRFLGCDISHSELVQRKLDEGGASGIKDDGGKNNSKVHSNCHPQEKSLTSGFLHLRICMLQLHINYGYFSETINRLLRVAIDVYINSSC